MFEVKYHGKEEPKEGIYFPAFGGFQILETQSDVDNFLEHCQYGMGMIDSPVKCHVRKMTDNEVTVWKKARSSP